MVYPDLTLTQSPRVLGAIKAAQHHSFKQNKKGRKKQKIKTTDANLESHQGITPSV